MLSEKILKWMAPSISTFKLLLILSQICYQFITAFQITWTEP